VGFLERDFERDHLVEKINRTKMGQKIHFALIKFGLEHLTLKTQNFDAQVQLVKEQMNCNLKSTHYGRFFSCHVTAVTISFDHSHHAEGLFNPNPKHHAEGLVDPNLMYQKTVPQSM
jgi:hypothetical protein